MDLLCTIMTYYSIFHRSKLALIISLVSFSLRNHCNSANDYPSRNSFSPDHDLPLNEAFMRRINIQQFEPYPSYSRKYSTETGWKNSQRGQRKVFTRDTIQNRIGRLRRQFVNIGVGILLDNVICFNCSIENILECSYRNKNILMDEYKLHNPWKNTSYWDGVFDFFKYSMGAAGNNTHVLPFIFPFCCWNK